MKRRRSQSGGDEAASDEGDSLFGDDDGSLSLASSSLDSPASPSLHSSAEDDQPSNDPEPQPPPPPPRRVYLSYLDPISSTSSSSLPSGLSFFPDLISTALESSLLSILLLAEGGQYLGAKEGQEQAMLFGRRKWDQEQDRWTTGLPSWAEELINFLRGELQQRVASGQMDDYTWQLLFPEDQPGAQLEGQGPEQSEEATLSSPPSRQLILNHYTPPQGISSHIDLLNRFGDGIILVSLGSGIGMTFHRPIDQEQEQEQEQRGEQEGDQEGERGERVNLYLPPRSLVVLTGQARWQWEHGIDEDYGDWVKEVRAGLQSTVEFVPRRKRVSITLRFLKRGAEVLGPC